MHPSLKVHHKSLQFQLRPYAKKSKIGPRSLDGPSRSEMEKVERELADQKRAERRLRNRLSDSRSELRKLKNDKSDVEKDKEKLKKDIRSLKDSCKL